MKYVIPFFILLSLQLQGQKLFPLKPAHDSVEFSVIVIDKSLRPVYPADAALFQPKSDFPQPVSLQLTDGDLVLEYRAGKPGASKTFSINVEISTPEGYTLVPEPGEVLDAPAPTTGQRLLIWKDVVDRLAYDGSKYRLRVFRYLMGAVDCSGPYPAFTLRKKIPYYSAGGAGLVLIGLGQLFRAQKTDYYNSYRRNWESGADAPPPSDNPLTKARQKQLTFQICTWTGVGILAADGLFFLRKRAKIRQKQRDYEKFCGKATDVKLQPSGQGLGLILQF